MINDPKHPYQIRRGISNPSRPYSHYYDFTNASFRTDTAILDSGLTPTANATAYRTTLETDGVSDYIDMGLNPAALQTASTAIQAGTGFVWEFVGDIEATDTNARLFGAYSATGAFSIGHPAGSATNVLAIAYKTSSAGTNPKGTIDTNTHIFNLTSSGKLYVDSVSTLDKSTVTGSLTNTNINLGAIPNPVPANFLKQSILHHRIWLAVDLSTYSGGVPAVGNGWIAGKTVLYQDNKAFGTKVSGAAWTDDVGTQNATISGATFGTINSTYGVYDSGYMMCDGQGNYVDTGIYPNSASCLIVNAEFTTISPPADMGIGALDTVNGRRYYFALTLGGKWRVGYGAVFTDSIVNADKDRHDFMLSGGKLFVDGVEVADASAGAFSGTSIQPFYLGALSNGASGTPSNFSKCKIYSAAIT